MKYIKYLPYIVLFIVIIYGFKGNSVKDQFQKMKTLNQYLTVRKSRINILLFFLKNFLKKIIKIKYKLYN